MAYPVVNTALSSLITSSNGVWASSSLLSTTIVSGALYLSHGAVDLLGATAKATAIAGAVFLFLQGFYFCYQAYEFSKRFAVQHRYTTDGLEFLQAELKTYGEAGLALKIGARCAAKIAENIERLSLEPSNEAQALFVEVEEAAARVQVCNFEKMVGAVFGIAAGILAVIGTCGALGLVFSGVSVAICVYADRDQIRAVAERILNKAYTLATRKTISA